MAALLVLGACGGAGDPSGTAATATASRGATTTTVASTTATDPSDGSPGASDVGLVAVTLERTGGVGGLQQRVEVHADGSYVVAGDGGAARGRLTGSEAHDLALAVQQARLATARTAAPTERRSDEYTYVVRSQGHVLTATGTTLPAQVRPLVEALVALLQRGPSPQS